MEKNREDVTLVGPDTGKWEQREQQQRGHTGSQIRSEGGCRAGSEDRKAGERETAKKAVEGETEDALVERLWIPRSPEWKGNH